MELQKTVPSLEDKCLPMVQYQIQHIIQSHQENEFADESQFIEALKTVVQEVPPILHDKLAEIHLLKIVEHFDCNEWDYFYEMSELKKSDLSEEDAPFCDCEFDPDDLDMSYESFLESTKNCTKCVNEDEMYLDAALEVVCLLKIKKIKLCEGPLKIKKIKLCEGPPSNYPVHLMNKLIGLLDKMYYIESFGIHDYWNIDPDLLEDKLLKILPSWPNLIIFNCEEYCTNELLQFVCENCELLQEVNIRHCVEIDEPIEKLVICKNLRKVNLENITFEPKVYLKLLLESKSNDLIEIHGLDVYLCEVLDGLEEMNSSRTFKLQNLRVSKGKHTPDGYFWDYLSDVKYLHLMKKYFPSLTKITFRGHRGNPGPIVDFSYFLNKVSESCHTNGN